MTTIQTQDISILSKLGMSNVEIAVYRALLEEPGYISIRKLADSSDLNRGIVYEALKHLVVLNLVSYNQRGERRQYFAERPKKIYDLLESKKAELNQAHSQIQRLVPQLEATLKRQIGQPQVRFYEHDEGIAAILSDVLQTVSQLDDKIYYAYSHQAIRPYIYRQFPNFTKKRISLGIKVQTIKVGMGEIINPEDEHKRLNNPETVAAKSYQIIYGNKVAMISVSTDGTLYAVVFEEAGVATMQRIIFEQVWNNL